MVEDAQVVGGILCCLSLNHVLSGLLHPEQVIGGIEQSCFGGRCEGDLIIFMPDAETFRLQLFVLLYNEPDRGSFPCLLQLLDSYV